jgi:serine protease Do
MGIDGSEINDMTAMFYNMPVGLMITAVAPNGGAYNAGLRANDIITKIDDKDIATIADVNAILKNHKPGDVIKVTYYRAGQTSTVNLTLTEKK